MVLVTRDYKWLVGTTTILIKVRINICSSFPLIPVETSSIMPSKSILSFTFSYQNIQYITYKCMIKYYWK